MSNTKRPSRYPEEADIACVPGTTWVETNVQTLANYINVTISADTLVNQTVAHYSIPSVQAFGRGSVELGEEIDSNKNAVKAGDLLVSKLNPRKQTICIVLEEDFPIVASTEFVVLRGKRAREVEFLRYFFLSKEVHSMLSSKVESATRSHQRVQPKHIYGALLRAPACPGLRSSIVDFLDRETTRIQILIAKQKQLIELLKEKRQAVISQAVTKGLDPDVPMKDSGVEWLGEVPSHWTVRRMKHVSPKIGVGLVVNPSTYTTDEGVPFIFGAEIKQFEILTAKARRIDPADSAALPASMLRGGDLLVVRVGDPGVAAVVDESLEGANCASVALIRRGRFDSQWMCCCMNSWVGRRQVDRVVYGAAQKQFNVSDAKEFLLPLPAIAEQTSIAQFVTNQLASFGEQLKKSAQMILLLQERRTALISAAVTGQIDVTTYRSSRTDAASAA